MFITFTYNLLNCDCRIIKKTIKIDINMWGHSQKQLQPH